MNEEASLKERLRQMTRISTALLQCFEKAVENHPEDPDYSLGRAVVESGRQVIAIHGLAG